MRPSLITSRNLRRKVKSGSGQPVSFGCPLQK